LLINGPYSGERKRNNRITIAYLYDNKKPVLTANQNTGLYFKLMTKLNIEGLYPKQGTAFFSQQDLFKIVRSTRNPKPGQTSEFLMLKPCCGHSTLPDGKPYRFVSGLLPTGPGTYQIDFEGVPYTVTITDLELTIQPDVKGPVLQSYVPVSQ
jgi:hypothetical protein